MVVFQLARARNVLLGLLCFAPLAHVQLPCRPSAWPHTLLAALSLRRRLAQPCQQIDARRPSMSAAPKHARPEMVSGNVGKSAKLGACAVGQIDV